MCALCSPAFPCEKEHLWSVVSLDATQIHQVIVNPATTVSHAIGSSPGTITINLASRVIGQDDHLLRPDIQEGLYVCLSVVDSGCGMDPATVQRIFDPFFTTKPIGQGTGLGLSVVHEIVSCYGGTITVYSEPGKGSCFRLYFPAIAGSAPVASTSTPAPTPTSREHILYVDDEEGLVMLGTVLLQRLGYQATGHVDASAALADFRSRPDYFAAMVTDLSMPRMTDFDLATQILRLCPGFPVLMTSGFVRPKTREPPNCSASAVSSPNRPLWTSWAKPWLRPFTHARLLLRPLSSSRRWKTFPRRELTLYCARISFAL